MLLHNLRVRRDLMLLSTHKVFDLNSDSCQVQGEANPALFGRMAAVCPHKTANCLQLQIAFEACPGAESYGE